MSENGLESAKKHGCAPLGCLIIIVAIVAVIFYFLVKPALEKRGITVEAIEDKITNAEATIDVAGDQVNELHEQATDKLDQLKHGAKEKMPKVPIRLYQD